ncbi:Protein of unknown function [Thermoanaerobacter thermohydrosulfuricus]|uniref:DUF3006 domain-containing protein n=3 Tax=Thermoanaerobacter TaxID=1754 RepID=M8CRR3_THETY|nr:Protein of unknown function (DUF3006) [Thermoanaerobacter thermohydrosulfuricus WC1]SDG77182.1 Protein of unknown function [Thermoanaerobacter thermohydrosulfuricus]
MKMQEYYLNKALKSNITEFNGEVQIMSKKTSRLCIIDRFEGDWAVIEYGNKTFNFPKELLPQNAKEGDVLIFNVLIDEKETENRKKIMEDLAKELFKEE